MKKTLFILLALFSITALAQVSVNLGANGVSINAGDVKVESAGPSLAPKPPIQNERAIMAPIRERVDINGSGQEMVVACRGKDLEVNGSGNTITTTGVCSVVTIKGSGNEVRVEVVGVIKVDGSSNEVYWKKAMTGQKPNINISGSANTVQQY